MCGTCCDGEWVTPPPSRSLLSSLLPARTWPTFLYCAQEEICGRKYFSRVIPVLIYGRTASNIFTGKASSLNSFHNLLRTCFCLLTSSFAWYSKWTFQVVHVLNEKKSGKPGWKIYRGWGATFNVPALPCLRSLLGINLNKSWRGIKVSAFPQVCPIQSHSRTRQFVSRTCASQMGLRRN